MNILFTGAHTDDIEHGAGGALHYFLEKGIYKVKYLSFSKCTDLLRNKGILEEQKKVKQYITSRNGSVVMLDMPNKKLSSCMQDIREYLEKERDTFNPHLVFTHWIGDIHQDHQAVTCECIRVFRNCSLLGYECLRSCPKFIPNFFLALREIDIQKKISLLSLYQTQTKLYYNNSSTIYSLAKIRGVGVGRDFAEGFDIIRIISEEGLCV